MSKPNGNRGKAAKGKRQKSTKRDDKPFSVLLAMAKERSEYGAPCVHITPCWAVIDNETGSEVSVREHPQDRWYDARALGCMRLGEKLKRYVSIDAVKLEWLP